MAHAYRYAQSIDMRPTELSDNPQFNTLNDPEILSKQPGPPLSYQPPCSLVLLFLATANAWAESMRVDKVKFKNGG